MKQRSQLCVWLDRRDFLAVDELAAQRGQSRSEFARAAILNALTAAQTDPIQKRLITLAEFTQAALNLVVQENYPSRREGLVADVAARLEKYHGIR